MAQAIVDALFCHLGWRAHQEIGHYQAKRRYFRRKTLLTFRQKQVETWRNLPVRRGGAARRCGGRPDKIVIELDEPTLPTRCSRRSEEARNFSSGDFQSKLLRHSLKRVVPKVSSPIRMVPIKTSGIRQRFVSTQQMTSQMTLSELGGPIAFFASSFQTFGGRGWVLIFYFFGLFLYFPSHLILHVGTTKTPKLWQGIAAWGHKGQT